MSAADFKTIQQEVEKENEKGEAKRLLRMQSIEAEKLDVMLKVLRVFLFLTLICARNRCNELVSNRRCKNDCLRERPNEPVRRLQTMLLMSYY